MGRDITPLAVDVFFTTFSGKCTRSFRTAITTDLAGAVAAATFVTNAMRSTGICHEIFRRGGILDFAPLANAVPSNLSASIRFFHMRTLHLFAVNNNDGPHFSGPHFEIPVGL